MSGFLPSSDLVATAWLETLTLPTDAVGTTLPADPTAWATQGFVQVSTVGGSPDMYVPVRSPAISIDCWTNSPDSEQSPWNRCGHLAESVLAAVYAFADRRTHLTLTMPSGYQAVRLMAMYPTTEPRRLLGDPSGFAHVNMDMVMSWVAA